MTGPVTGASAGLKARLLGAAIEDWRSRGLIDAETAARLQGDLGRREARGGFAGFILIAGIVCLAAAAMTFVAANWDAIPRGLRVIGLFGMLWAGWGATGWAARRGAPRLAEGLAILSSAVLGAAIMLIAQIYQMQGPPDTAVLLWALGALAAVVTGYRGTLVLSALLFALWYAMVTGDDLTGWREAVYPASLVVCGVAARALRSRLTAHVVMIGALSWLVLSILPDYQPEDLVVPLISAFLGGMAWMVALSGSVRPLEGFEGAGLVYLGLFAGFFIAYAHIGNQEDPGTLTFARSSLIGVALSVAAAAFAAWRDRERLALVAGLIVLQAAAVALYSTGRHWPVLSEAYLLAYPLALAWAGWQMEMRPLRVLASLGFVASVLTVYAQTIGTLLGTSAFYLGVGIILVAGAGALTIIARRRAPGAGGPGEEA